MKKLVLLSALFLSAAVGFAQKTDARYHHPDQGGPSGYYTNSYSPPEMSPQEFAGAQNMIGGRAFDDDRLTVAMQVARGNRLSSGQVRVLLDLFSFESTRVAFAKGAYDHVIDPYNYWAVNDGFRFSSSIDELNDYISTHGVTGQVIMTSGSYGVNSGAPACGGGQTSYSTGTMSASGGVVVGHPAPVGNVGVNSYYNGAPGHCVTPAPMPVPVCMAEADFQRIFCSVRDRSFDSDRLAIAKQAFGSRLMSADMVRRMLAAFSFESSRLEFAKFAYAQTIDRHNYYIVNDGFTFSSSIRDLERYIQNFR
jgi:hypothetical protein